MTTTTNGPDFSTRFGVLHGDSTEWEQDGFLFRAEIHHDDYQRKPWEEEDGHGPIRETRIPSYQTHPDKTPGERVLYADRGYAYLYDFAEAVRIARRDGWGIGPEEEAKLAERLGRAPTAGELVEASVKADFERMRGWINDEWYYVGVVVTVYKEVNGRKVELGQNSLWGIENDSGDYFNEVALECAAEALVEAEATLEGLR